MICLNTLFYNRNGLTSAAFHQCFIDKNTSVSHHHCVKAPLQFYDLEHYVSSRQAGIERCEQVWLVCCLKPNCELLQQSFQVTYTSETFNCVHM